MSDSIYSLGVSGLNAAQAGLVTTGHNITNASTPGYHRQAIQQSALLPLRTGSGFFGQGVQVDTVVRAYSQFLESSLSQAQAQASYYTAYHTQMTQIDNVVADSNAGLSPALQAFFSAAQAVAVNPPDMAARQSMLSAGSTLAARFNSLAGRFDELQASVNSQLTSAVTSANSLAVQIAALNNSILNTQKNANQPPNDLLDQRDALVAQLNQLVGGSVVRQSDGTINVSIGNGQNLVVGSQSMTLAAVTSPEDPQRVEIAYGSGGNAIMFGPSTFQAGSIGGLLAFRVNDLDSAQNALGRVAAGLTQTLNDQHRLGQDLNGAAGANFFAPLSPVVLGNLNNAGTAVVAASISDVSALATSDYRLSYNGANYAVTRVSDNTTTTYASMPQTVDGVTISIASGTLVSGDSFLIEPTRNAARNMAMSLRDPAMIAAAAPVRTAAASANTGSAAISAGVVNAPPPPNANLLQPVSITFTAAGTFDVTGLGTTNPTGVAYTPGAAITYNGWTVEITGTPAAGDVFTIVPNSGGVADGRNALLLTGLQTQNTLSGGNANFQGAYSQMVSQVGNKTQQVDAMRQTQSTLVSDASVAQQSLSGVNLDEEAANLLRYQQAYQAAGKMMQIAETLFRAVLELG
jgi:flagellar hook-associated protein 1 FlgK